MRREWSLIALAVVAAQNAQNLAAAQLHKLPGVRKSSLPAGFPVHVQKLASHALQGWSPSLPDRIAIPQGRGHPSHGEEVLPSRDGSLLLFLPDEGRPYVRAFDPARGDFLDDEPYAFATPHVGVAMGKSAVAGFVAEGKVSLMKPPRRLALEIVSFDAGAFRIRRPWGSSELNSFVSADMNERGDLVALVARCSLATDVRPHLVYDRFTLLRVPSDGPVLERELPAATMDATVAVSASGLHAALYMSQKRAGVVRVLETATLQPKGADRILSRTLTGRQLVARALAVNDDGAAAAAIYAWYGSPPADLMLVFVSPEGSCDAVARYPWNADRIDLFFFGRQFLYVGVTPALEGEPPAADVYRYGD